MSNENTIDARSPEGITIGLIEAIQTIAQIVAYRSWGTPAIREALEDLRSDKALLTLMGNPPPTVSDADACEPDPPSKARAVAGLVHRALVLCEPEAIDEMNRIVTP